MKGTYNILHTLAYNHQSLTCFLYTQHAASLKPIQTTSCKI